MTRSPARVAALLTVVLALTTSLRARRLGGSSGATPPPEPGNISGVVVDAATKRPIAGVYVILGTAYYDNAPAIQATDGQGRFVFGGLPTDKTYSLRATKPGYFETIFRASSSDLSSTIALNSREWMKDIRVELARPGSISGIVTDESGAPVVDAFVRLIAFVPVLGRRQMAAGPVTKTDDRGMYRFGGLGEGRYIVSVPSSQDTVNADTPLRVGFPPKPGEIGMRDAPAVDVTAKQRLIVGSFATPPPPTGERPLVYPITFFPSVGTFADATPIDLRSADSRSGVDIQLRPVPTWSLSGRVSVTGTSGAGAGVTLRLIAAGMEDLGLGSEVASTLVAGDGSFAFLGVPPGTYTIEGRESVLEYRYNRSGSSTPAPLPISPGLSMFSGAGGELRGAPPGTQWWISSGSPGTTWASTPVELPARDVTDIVVRLHAGTTLSGRVVPETSTATPGMRNSPATVIAEPASGATSQGGGMSNANQSDPTAFAIKGLRPGAYLLRAWGGRVMSITWNGKDYTHTPFDASEGQDYTDIVITTTTRVSSLAGTVASAAAAPNAAVVLMFPADPSRWANAGIQRTEISVLPVDTRGRFQTSPTPGDYFLVALDSVDVERSVDAAFLTSVSGMASRVIIDWDDKKIQDLKLAQVPR